MKTKTHNTRSARRLACEWREERWRLPLVRREPGRWRRFWNGHRFPAGDPVAWEAVEVDLEAVTGEGGDEVRSEDELSTTVWMTRSILPWRWPDRGRRPQPEVEPMRLYLCKRLGFTLVELLVVISIIGILAGLLLPALAGAKNRAKEGKARAEMQSLVAAISQYEAEYSRYPASKIVEDRAGTNDVTFVPDEDTEKEIKQNLVDGGGVLRSLLATNLDDVIVILLDEDYGANKDHRRNPKRNAFFTAKAAQDDSSPGIGSDWMFRDPWGMPYIISVDMNGDGRVDDGQYGEIAQAVVVWSFGKDQQNRWPEDNNNLVSWR